MLCGRAPFYERSGGSGRHRAGAGLELATARDHLQVALADDGDAVTLTVTDDGVGFDPSVAAGPTSFGLAGIHERASLLGATLLVRSAPGKGTTIAVRLPSDRA